MLDEKLEPSAAEMFHQLQDWLLNLGFQDHGGRQALRVNCGDLNYVDLTLQNTGNSSAERLVVHSVHGPFIPGSSNFEGAAVFDPAGNLLTANGALLDQISIYDLGGRDLEISVPLAQLMPELARGIARKRAQIEQARLTAEWHGGSLPSRPS